ncbi:hypothetical protein [Deinococcus sp.]|uniref:3D domain-containing protein n=1 Tax=Deinococcus sp. TaxID=47478 RepID=UPI0025F3E721|nr:hypothetical protein [Deinococcus sp.]
MKRVHVAGVLALGLSGFAAAQTTTNPATPAPDQAPPETGTAIHQSGSASFLSPSVLGSTLTQHLAGAALLLHQEAPLWPRLPLTSTIPAPIPEVTVDEGAAQEGVAAAPAPGDTAPQVSAGAAQLAPQIQAEAEAQAQATFNEDTDASPAPDVVKPSAVRPSTVKPRAAQANTVKPSTPEALFELKLPVLPSAALTGSVVDLALATPTQAGSQLARLRLLQAQNPRRPSQAAAQAAVGQAMVGQTAVGQAQVAPVVAAPVVVRPVPTRPITVDAPVPEVTAGATKAEATQPVTAKPTTAKPTTPKPTTAKPARATPQQAAPAPVINVTVRTPAVSAPLTTTARKAPASAVVRTAAPVKQIVTATRPPAPTVLRATPVKPDAAGSAAVKADAAKADIAKADTVKSDTAKPDTAKPDAAKPVAAAPIAVKPAPAQLQAAAPSTRSLGRPVSNGARRTVSATAYSSDVGQTDNSPFVTATGTRVRPGVIALSRDLLRTFPYGSRVTIQDAGGVLNGRVFIVEDTMNARLRNTIDVWMGSRRQAYQWGRRTVTITAVR